VESFRGRGVVKLISSNGCEHTSAITEDGELWTCGYNARGQLGHGNKTHQSVPRLVDSLRAYRVKHISCSYYHSIVSCEDDKIFGFGRNDYGQLGLGHNDDKLRPTPITFFNGQRVVDIACGQYHSLVSVGSGGIFAFGKNDYGQLGIVPNEPKWHPVMVTGSDASSSTNTAAGGLLTGLGEGELIPRIACGYYHSLALKQDGTVFSFGRNDYGQLGLGNNENVRVPTQVMALSTLCIREITSGCYHSIALTRTGSVYVWGRNNHGQLGIGTTDDSNTPSRIDALIHKTAIQVTAGFYHTLVLTGNPDEADSIGGYMNNYGGNYGGYMNYGMHSESGMSSSFGNHHHHLHNNNHRDNKHPLMNSLSNDLKTLLNNPARSDVTFMVEGRPIYAHRCVIMCRCDPLERMLEGPMRESSQKEIVLHEQQYEVFMALLEYLYTDRVAAIQSKTVKVEFALDLLSVADQFLVEKLKLLCENSIQKSIDVDNVAHMLSTADQRQAHGLRKKCFEYILRHFGKVIGTQAFSEISKPLLQEVLFAASKRGVHLR
jgi:RCC1 and BTB domain-containing protein